MNVPADRSQADCTAVAAEPYCHLPHRLSADDPMDSRPLFDKNNPTRAGLSCPASRNSLMQTDIRSIEYVCIFLITSLSIDIGDIKS